MKKESLLDDVLKEGAPAEFRTVLLEQTLRQVRRRRRVRQLGRCLAVLAVAAAFPALLWKQAVKPPAPPSAGNVRAEPAAVEVVRSRPLRPEMIVSTRGDAVQIVVSNGVTTALVETQAGENSYQELTDEELLDLFSGRPVALVRQSPHEARLMFLNPDDEKGFPVQ